MEFCVICNVRPRGHNTMRSLCVECAEKLIQEQEKEKEELVKLLGIPYNVPKGDFTF